MCEVVADEYGCTVSEKPVAIFTQSGDARYDNADKMIIKGAQVLPHALINHVETKLGKKGEKLPRMNMAFAPENYDHIQLMGRLMGCSATEYVNRLIAADREARGDVIEQALKLFKEVKSR